jgi:hypothetical protein
VPIVVTDGILNIDFVSKKGSPKINAISVTSVGLLPPTATRTFTVSPTATHTSAVSPTATNTPGGAGTPTPTSSPTAVGSYAQRVNVGGARHVDAHGAVWAADQVYTTGSWGYTGGQVMSTVQSIAGADEPVLYQTNRFYISSYKFTVPNDYYRVTLKFAEIYPYTSVGQRVFNVKLQGQTVISQLDVMAAVGRFAALDYTFYTTVSGGLLTIDFISVAGATQVNAIEVVSSGVAPTPTGTATRTYPDPAPTKIMEAESGVLTPLMTIIPDSAAYGNAYIIDPGGPDSHAAADFTFYLPDIPYVYNAYSIWARVQAPDEFSNSVYFSLDGEPDWVWYFTPGPNWQWDKSPAPLPLNGWLLTLGMTHTLHLGSREPNLKIDLIVLTDRHEVPGLP